MFSKKKLLKRGLIVAVLTIALLVVCDKVVEITRWNHIYEPPTMQITQILIEYIRTHNGEFPSYEEDLISQEYLRKTETVDGIEYEINRTPKFQQNWNICPRFAEFTIAYGVNTDELILEGDRLYNKITNEPVYLIDGPRKGLLPEYYAECSATIFEKMQEIQKACNNDP